MSKERRLELSLLLLRLSVFLVMLMWTIDKFIRPSHAEHIFKEFYHLSGISNYGFYLFGAAELLLLLAFLFGIKKKLSYGLLFIIYAISTFASWKHFIDPYEGGNLMFFTAWPMLAACYALYLLRDSDKLYSLNK